MNFAKLLELAPMIGNAFLALCVLATVLVRLIPGGKGVAQVDSLSAKLMKLLSFLPTLGINPRTKALEEALKEMQEMGKK